VNCSLALPADDCQMTGVSTRCHFASLSRIDFGWCGWYCGAVVRSE